VEIGGQSFGEAGELDIVGIVDSWSVGQVGTVKRGPYVSSVVLPSYISAKGFVPTFKAVPVEPVYLDSNGRLRVNVRGLASWWLSHSRSRSDRDRAQQLGAPTAMAAEAKMLEWETSPPAKGKRYLVTSEAESRAILAEAGYDYEHLIEEHKHPARKDT
jgi:hypothetical protein